MCITNVLIIIFRGLKFGDGKTGIMIKYNVIFKLLKAIR